VECTKNEYDLRVMRSRAYFADDNLHFSRQGCRITFLLVYSEYPLELRNFGFGPLVANRRFLIKGICDESTFRQKRCHALVRFEEAVSSYVNQKGVGKAHVS
jgi:hypothetical protein